MVKADLLKLTGFKFALRKVCTAVICCAVLLSAFFIFPFELLALNTDYLKEEKWIDNARTETVYIEATSVENSVNGYFSYYTDDSLCIYTRFKISETTLSEDAESVFITYSFHMPTEDYEVTVGRNGVYSDEEHPAHETIFKAAQSFDSLGSYYSAVQYIGREYSSCSVDVSLFINGHVYRITENEELFGRSIYMELPTTVKETTTKKSSEKSPSKDKATQKAQTTKAKKETTTKFKPEYNITTRAKAGAKEAESSSAKKGKKKEDASSEQESSVNENFNVANTAETQLSRPARIFLLLGLLLAVAGAAVLITAAALKDKNENEEAEDKDADETEKRNINSSKGETEEK